MIGIVIAAAAIVVAAVVVVAAWRAQQRTARRVVEVVERLGESPPPKVTTSAAIERLSRSVDRVQKFDDVVRLAEVRLELALNEVEQGIVICDARGDVVTRNAPSLAFVGAR